MKFLPNYFFTFFPVIVVMVVNPVLYSLSTGYIYHIITSYMAQYSTNERKMLDLFKQRFALINLGFYLCWSPNLINAVIVWTSWDNLPNGVMLILWYLMVYIFIIYCKKSDVMKFLIFFLWKSMINVIHIIPYLISILFLGYLESYASIFQQFPL